MKRSDHRSSGSVLLAASLLLGCIASCTSPSRSSVILRTENGEVYGLSTESGILALGDAVGTAEQVEFRYHIGNGFFDDTANVERRGAELVVLRPASSRPNQARLAAYPARPGDKLWIEVPDGHGDSDLLVVQLFEQGRRGNLLVTEAGVPIESQARDMAGAGLFVKREGFLQLAGILNGIYTEEGRALGFIGVDRIAQVLPAGDPYFERRAFPRRADFEYGMPRFLDGERVIASGHTDPSLEAAEAPDAPPPDADPPVPGDDS